MSNVLTLISAPSTRALTETQLHLAKAALQSARASLINTDWLAPDLAVDLFFEGSALRVETAVRAALADEPIDIGVQAVAGRRKRLLVADMDSTIIKGETLDELASLAGKAAEIVPITERSMRGEVSFEESLRERVAMLKGTALGTLEEVIARIELTPGARLLVRTMRANGAYTALVSGGFEFCTEPVAELCGFHEQRANELLHAHGFLTGEVREPILGRDSKAAALRELCARNGLEPSAAVGVGDGANDIALIEAAGLGVAFHGKPKTKAAARFKVDHGDLTSLLYLQGYREKEFCD